MMKKVDCVARSALVLALAAGSISVAAATDSGPYIGVNVGQSKADISDEPSGLFNVLSSSTTDDTDTAWALSAGYRFNPVLALEVAYNDLGKSTFTETGSRTVSFPPYTGTLSGNASVKGASAALIAAIPINQWELFVRAGAFFAKTKIESQASVRTLITPVQTASASDSESANTTEFMAGVGVGYTIADHYHVKLEWTKIPKVGDEEKTGETDVSVLSAGFQYRF